MKRTLILLLICLFCLTGCVYTAHTANTPTITEVSKTEPLQTPPSGTLSTPAETVPLEMGGYSWSYRIANEWCSTAIADQYSRPPEDLTPVSVDTQYAESVTPYAIPGADGSCPGYPVTPTWAITPTTVTYTCWPDSVLQDSTIPEETLVSTDDGGFYAKEGGYIYEIVVTWETDSYKGSGNYYAYIVGGSDHIHQPAADPQTVENPISGYCGNTQTTIHKDGKDYTFMYGYSVTLTDILLNLNYGPACRCMAEFTVDTEFETGYAINLSKGFVRCRDGQASLTPEQVEKITEILTWAETTNCTYPMEE